ncbi:MAG: hypothetical protein SOT18_09230, partial [Eubacterium sp.]|nr:hypothetical protein [Eubacterium sp.]
MAEKKLKVCFVGSSGGHLTHLYMLKPFWKNKDRFWVTFDKEDATLNAFLQALMTMVVSRVSSTSQPTIQRLYQS